MCVLPLCEGWVLTHPTVINTSTEYVEYFTDNGYGSKANTYLGPPPPLQSIGETATDSRTNRWRVPAGKYFIHIYIHLNAKLTTAQVTSGVSSTDPTTCERSPAPWCMWTYGDCVLNTKTTTQTSCCMDLSTNQAWTTGSALAGESQL